MAFVPRAPYVSVVVTTYNHGKYIGAALESVLAQSFRDYEVIVVDDGSTDDTGDVLESFRQHIMAIRQPNAGVAGARNAGVARVRGELVAFLDGDDLWHPDKLQAQVTAAATWPTAGMYVTDGVQFSDDRTVSPSLFGHGIRKLLDAPAAELGIAVNCYPLFLRGNLVFTMSQVAVRHSALMAVGPSDQRFPLSSDWDLHLRLASRFACVFIARPLVKWRYIPTSASGPLERRRLNWDEDDVRILRKALRSGPPEFEAVTSRLLRQRIRDTCRTAYLYGREYDRRWAIGVLARIWRLHRWQLAAPAHLAALLLPRRAARWLARVFTPGAPGSLPSDT
jgi:glycosyl transferase family 2